MSTDPPDPTRTSHDRPDPGSAPETRDAPPPREPGTITAGTHTHDRDPAGASTATRNPADPTGAVDAAPAEPFPAPQGFVIERELGSGGMGVVYEARQTRLNRKVALKVLRDGRADARDLVRFLAEAEAVAAVKHPHVVQVFEFGQEDGRPFMALELLTGGTLSEKLRGGKLDPRAAAELGVKLADAVRAAHDLGIVHRDLKPGNVLFDERGEPKVTDFGLAKRAGGADLTRTQAVMGTPAYMAPEQARGEAKFVGPAADVWSLGVILYECLTGKRAFDADDTWAVLRKVTDEAPPSPRSHVPGLPRDLELISLKCLEKKPADRYPSVAALGDDLQRFLDGKPVSVHPAGSVERLVKWVRRNPVLAYSTAAVALALVAGSAVSLAFGLEARRRGDALAKANDELTASEKRLTDANAGLRAFGLKLSETVNELTVSQARLKDAVKETDRRAVESEERGYLSDVALAHQLWKANDLAGMRAALDRCPADRRRWEWRYLKGLSRPERAEHITDALPLALAYSPDGKSLAYTTFAGTLTVLDLGTDKPRHTIPGDGQSSNRLASIAFHPGGGELAYVMSGRVRVVDLATGKWRELKDPKQPDGNPGNRSGSPTVAVGYAPDGRLLAAAIGSGKQPGTREFVIRDAVTAKPVSTFVAVEQPQNSWADLTGAAFSPDGKRFAASVVDSGIRVRGAGGTDKPDTPTPPRVLVWEAESGKPLGQGEVGSNLLGGIAFDPAGAAVGLGRRGGGGELLVAPAGEKQYHVGNHLGDVLAVAFDRGGLIWFGGEDKMIRAHDRKTGAERFAVRGCSRTILRLAVSPDGKEVAAAAGDLPGTGGVVYRFDASALAADHWRAPADERDRVSLVAALAPDGSRFAAYSFRPFDERPESVRFVTREVAGGAERVVSPARPWFRGAFAPDGRLFVLDRAKPADRVEQVREIGADGKPGRVAPLPPDETAANHAAAVACTTDGRTLAAVDTKASGATLGARLLVADAKAPTWREVGAADLSDFLPPKARFGTLQPLAATTDLDGRRLAAVFAASWEGEGQSRFESRGALVVWDLATGKQLLRKSAAVPLCAVAFDPRGRVVAAGGSPAGGVVFGWDTATGEQFLSQRGHTRPILSLAFGPDGRFATGGLDRVVKLWDLASRREVLTLDGFAREVTHLAFTADGTGLVAATGLDMLSAMAAVGTPTDWPPAEVRVFRGPK